MSSINQNSTYQIPTDLLAHRERYERFEIMETHFTNHSDKFPFLYKRMTTLEKVKLACLFLIPIVGQIVFANESKRPTYSENVPNNEILVRNLIHYKELRKKGEIYLITTLAVLAILSFAALLPPASPIFFAAIYIGTVYFMSFVVGFLQCSHNESEKKLHFAHDLYYFSTEQLKKSQKEFAEKAKSSLAQAATKCITLKN